MFSGTPHASKCCFDHGTLMMIFLKYLIFADLKVIQSSPRTVAKELLQLGYKDFNNLTELYRNVGLKQKVHINFGIVFENSLSKGMSTFSPEIGQPNTHHKNHYTNIKVTVSKSKKKILHAEAGEDFVDYLLSFLTAPLGSVLKLLGSMDNLYKSVKDLNSSWFFTMAGRNP
ncbi:hypothetical protein PIB30_023412 [Stylosanthes scabra]|uniref:Uncharacterized protein n=1 Tax=Stylosanthes scabra TaxID=79078 RepID=A0ABU6X6Z9_9FABA|nr:hypothetical protein [Stylosanthes scabra]